MADKTSQLILDALSRAAAEPGGLPLHGGKTAPGLFPPTTPARQAAQRCKDEGLVRVVRTETRGKSELEWCALTDKGLAYLVGQVSPRQVLEDLVRALEARQGQIGSLLAAAQQARDNLEALKGVTEKVLLHIHRPQTNGTPGPSSPAWTDGVLDFLAAWQQTRGPDDCSLPELYATARQAAPGLTVGRFHDGLRLLHDRERIYLHPWTGPLYEIPEPSVALLIGHQIVYYASRRAA